MHIFLNFPYFYVTLIFGLKIDITSLQRFSYCLLRATDSTSLQGKIENPDVLEIDNAILIKVAQVVIQAKYCWV